MNNQLAQTSARLRTLVDGDLARRAEAWEQAGWPAPLAEAARYTLFGGGKRVRPVLALMAAEATGGDAHDALPWACAVEMIHTYSLVHDDLPAMDDDAERRGRPTCHVKFGEALAILAGDTLFTEAFGVIAEKGAELTGLLARAAGGGGMVGGQVLDIGGGLDTLDALVEMQRLKTGALIHAAGVGGALSVSAPPETVEALSRYGRALGLLFQITDDLLDAEQDAGRDPCNFLHFMPHAEVLALRDAAAATGSWRLDDATLLVNGSQQGIDLLVRTLVSPGEVVVTERPAYKGALRIFQAARAQVRCLPMDEEGLSLQALERTLRQDKVRLLYLTPTFQNPAGCSMGSERRKRILHLAHTHQVPILEDGCFRELRFEGTPPPSLKSLDAEGLVIHLGTYSKTLFPGLRVGWIAAPRPLAERLSRARHDMDLGSVTLAQMVIHNLYVRGDIARQLDRVRRAYKERRDALLQGLDRHLPGAVSWTRPEGGMSLWVHLPPGLGSRGVVRRAARAGVLVAPGALFDPFGNDMDGFRLAFSMARPEAMDQGAEILGEAIRAEIRNRQTSAQPPESRLPVV